jgi:hypothetical protein
MNDLSIEDLVRALVDARRYRRAHPDLRAHFSARASAIARAFAVDLDSPPTDHEELFALLQQTLRRLDAIESPFAVYLEAPEQVAEMHRRHGAAINDACRRLHDACVDLAAHILATMWDLEGSATITRVGVRAQGFDLDAPAPDPSDYL